MDRPVRAVASYDFDGAGPRPPALLVAGDFYSINGVATPSPATDDGSGFTPLRTGLRNASVKQFAALDLDGAGPQPADLYAVGSFTLETGLGSVGVVRWTPGLAGQPDRWVAIGAPSTSGLASALSLTVHDFDGEGPAAPRLVAVAAGNPTAGLVQQWTGSSWVAVGNNNRATGSKSACSVDHDGPGGQPPQLYLVVGNSIPMRFNGTSWVGLSGLNNPVEAAVAFDVDGAGPQGPRLVVTGSRPFNIGGRECAVASYDGAAWNAVGPSFGFTNSPNNLLVVPGPNPGTPASLVFSLNSFGARLFRWNSAGFIDGGVTGGWDLLAGTVSPFTSGDIAGVAFHDPDGAGHAPTETIVVGDFRLTSGNVPVSHLAKVQGNVWTPLAEFSAVPDGTVLALKAFDVDGPGPDTPKLFVGGHFTTVRGVAAPALATWDGRRWAPPGAFASTLPLSTRVGAMAIFDDDGAGPRSAGLYVGGYFDSIDDVPAGHVARLDASGWSALGSGFANLQISGGTYGVSAMLVVDLDGPGPQGESLVVAGGFADVDGQAHGQIAAWNGAAWTPMGLGAPGEVLGLAAFPQPSGPPLLLAVNYRGTLAQWIGTSWQSTANFFSGSAGYLYFAKMVDDDGDGPLAPYLLAGGPFDNVGGVPAPQGLARFDGQAWSSWSLTDNYSSTQAAASLDMDGAGPEPVRTILAGNFSRLSAGTSSLAVRSVEPGGAVSYEFFGGYTYTGGINAIEVFADEPGQPPAIFIGGTFSGVGLINVSGGVPTGGLARLGCAPCVTFTSQPNGGIVRAAMPMTFDAAASIDGGEATYQWRRDGIPLADGGRISGSRTARLMLDGVGRGDAGSYDVLVTAPCGTMLSAAAMLRVTCDADLDGDGHVSAGDVHRFVEGFLTGRVSGDFNRDFRITVQDLFDFLNAYFRGC